MALSTSDKGSDHFSAAAQQVVDYLNAHTAIQQWSVSRVAGGEQVHLHVHAGEDLGVGTRVAWPETFCRRMVAGADHVVPDTSVHPQYSDLSLAGKLRGYAGVPIAGDDGTMFGVLCGVSAEPLESVEVIDVDLLQIFSDLLSEHLRLSRLLDRGRRQLEITQALAQRDALTGLLNRTGWDMLVDDAQQRIDAFGDLVSVAVIDLDGLKQVNDVEGHQAGDDLLRRAGQVLTMQDRIGDRIARYGGDEFAILAHNVAVGDLETYFARFSRALCEAGIEASLGCAPAVPGAGLGVAFAEADALMYAAKRSRRTTV